MNTSLPPPKYDEGNEVFIIRDGATTRVKIGMVNPFVLSYTFTDLNNEIIKNDAGIPLQLSEMRVYGSKEEADQVLEQEVQVALQSTSVNNNNSNNSNNEGYEYGSLPGNTINNQEGGIRRRRRSIRKSRKTRKTRKTKRTKKNKRTKRI